MLIHTNWSIENMFVTIPNKIISSIKWVFTLKSSEIEYLAMLQLLFFFEVMHLFIQ